MPPPEAPPMGPPQAPPMGPPKAPPMGPAKGITTNGTIPSNLLDYVKSANECNDAGGRYSIPSVVTCMMPRTQKESDKAREAELLEAKKRPGQLSLSSGTLLKQNVTKYVSDGSRLSRIELTLENYQPGKKYSPFELYIYYLYITHNLDHNKMKADFNNIDNLPMDYVDPSEYNDKIDKRYITYIKYAYNIIQKPTATHNAPSPVLPPHTNAANTKAANTKPGVTTPGVTTRVENFGGGSYRKCKTHRKYKTKRKYKHYQTQRKNKRDKRKRKTYRKK